MKKELFSLAQLMEKELQKINSDQPEVFENLEQAANLLATASEILEDLGFEKESSNIINLLEKIADDSAEKLLDQEIDLDNKDVNHIEINDELTFEDEI